MYCNICLNDKFNFLYQTNDLKHYTTNLKFDVIQCTNCGCLITTINKEVYNTKDYYPTNYDAYNIVIKISNSYKCFPFSVIKGRLAWILKVNISKTTRILDVGCGSGTFLKVIKDKFNPIIEGIDPSSNAVEAGKENGLVIKKGFIKDIPAENRYDIIYMLHVIEHLDDPTSELKYLYELLNHNGKLIIGTPNTRSLERYLFGKYWDGWDAPRHIYIFNTKSLKYLLKNIGFEEVQVYYEIYSLFYRSLINIGKANNKSINRLTLFMARRINKVLSYILPFLRFSGAIQVIATKK